MEEPAATARSTTLGIRKISAGDPFLERLQKINDLIAHRAYQLFADRQFAHGDDLKDWLQAEQEMVQPVPLEMRETETELTIRAAVPGFTEKDLEVLVDPQRLFISGKREEISEQKVGTVAYSKQLSNQIFRAVDLPEGIDLNEVRATLSYGVLEIRLPKTAATTEAPVPARAASA